MQGLLRGCGTRIRCHSSSGTRSDDGSERERDGTLSGQRLEEKEGGSDECGTVDSRLKYSARF